MPSIVQSAQVFGTFWDEMALNLKTILKIEMRVAFLTKSSDASYPSLRRVTTFISFIDIFKVYCVVALSAIICIAPKNHMTHEKIDVKINQFTMKITI